jgi:hypothetical protein
MQMFEKEVETHDMLLGLVDSVMDISVCVTDVKRFKTSDQLISRLQELEPMVLDVSKLVHGYQSKYGGIGMSSGFQNTSYLIALFGQVLFLHKPKLMKSRI